MSQLPPGMQELLAQILGPEIAVCIQDAQDTLAFDLSPSDREPFLAFHDFLTNPQPRFITEWRSSPRGEEKWYRALAELNGATRNAYTAVIYHFQNLSRMEADVMNKIASRGYKDAVGHSTVAIGNTLKWDFEYQAFVLAYRRCLDYLTRSLAAFFKQTFHSFRTMPKSLAGAPLQSVAQALIAVHKKHSSNFDFVLSEGDSKSVRDKISHYEWIQAGTINLTRLGFVLLGGGENLPFTSEQTGGRLTEALAARIQMLKDCISEMIAVFVAKAREWDLIRSHEN